MHRTDPEPAPEAAKERPWLFALLIAPTAVIAIGLVNGALSYLLRHQGVDPARGSEIVALLGVPHTIYFLWCPIADFWMKRRTWVLTASAASAAMMVLAFSRTSLASAWAIRLLFLSFCLGLLVAASCGGLMGALKSEVNRRRAGSFYQCGSLAVGGISVFALVSLAGIVSQGALGWVIAAMIALPALAALALPDVSTPSEQSLRATAAHIWREFKVTFLRWDAIPYTLLIVMPMCSGAMIGLLPALAADFGVSGAQVAWLNGLAGVLLTAAGSLSASLIPVRVRAPIAYLLAGLTNAATLAILALGPLRPAVYFTGTVLYLFSIGVCYALFTGVVLEFLGDSGKSGGTRYSIINSLGNLPVAYMSFVDGRGYAHWAARGMPGIDAILSAAVASLLLAYFLVRRAPQPAPA
jgi:MFS transporter, PAT family, beta-lactamase induction signal transducer AmpG